MVKKVFVTLALSVFFLAINGMNSVYIHAHYRETVSGTFDEIILQNFDSGFVSVHIRDDSNADSLFSQGMTITNRLEIRRMLNILQDVRLTGVNYRSAYLEYYDGIFLHFSDRAVSLVADPWGTHRHNWFDITIYAEHNLINIRTSVTDDFDGHGAYFYFDELDVSRLLNVNPISLLNRGVILAYVVLCVVIILLLRYYFGTEGAFLRKAVSMRTYIAFIWLILFSIAGFMANGGHPQFFIWILRIMFFAIALIILWHSKKHGLKNIMKWELAGIILALVWIILSHVPAAAPILSVLGWALSTVLILLFIGVPVYMLFLVLLVGYKPSERPIRTRISRVFTVIFTILFYLLLFHPHVFS